MEFVRLGNKLQTLIKWRTIGERPSESGRYLVIWNSPTKHYKVIEMEYSKKYDEWGVYDEWNTDEYREHESRAHITEDEIVGWYTQLFDECFTKDGEF